MAEAKTAEGVMIYTPAEKWGEGVECYVMDAEGNPAPAPDGSHTLESGEVVVVAGGLVTEYKAAGGEEEEMTAEELSTVMSAFEAKLTELSAELESYKAKFSESETKLSAITKDAESKGAKVQELEAEVVKLSKQPAAPSILKGGRMEGFKLNAEQPLGVQPASKKLTDMVRSIRESQGK